MKNKLVVKYCNSNNCFGVYDEINNKYAIEPKYLNINLFKDKNKNYYAVFRKNIGNCFGIMNLKEEVLLPEEYNDIKTYKSRKTGLLLIEKMDSKLSYYSQKIINIFSNKEIISNKNLLKGIDLDTYSIFYNDYEIDTNKKFILYRCVLKEKNKQIGYSKNIVIYKLFNIEGDLVLEYKNDSSDMILVDININYFHKLKTLIIKYLNYPNLVNNHYCIINENKNTILDKYNYINLNYYEKYKLIFCLLGSNIHIYHGNNINKLKIVKIIKFKKYKSVLYYSYNRSNIVFNKFIKNLLN